MALTIELEPEAEARLSQAAFYEGIEVPDYVRRLIERHLPDVGDPLVQLMLEWQREDATDDPAELEAREREWEELKGNLNANRAATGERLLFQ